MTVPATQEGAPAVAAPRRRRSPAKGQVNEYLAFLEMLERAARDPDVDVAKMRVLLDMQREVAADRAKVAYYAALADMQIELPVIEERGFITNQAGEIQSRYALWEDIVERIQPVIHKHGFALTFKTARDREYVVVTGRLTHRNGHAEESEFALPPDPSGKKNAVQALGSSVSYGKRYTATGLLNVVTRGADDDARTAGGGPGTIDKDEQRKLLAIAKDVKADLKRFCAYFGVGEIADIPKNRLPDAIEALEAKRAGTKRLEQRRAAA